MSSSYSSTYSSTYTIADVEKVVRSIKTDLIMIASSTRTMTENEAKIVADIKIELKVSFRLLFIASFLSRVFRLFT